MGGVAWWAEWRASAGGAWGCGQMVGSQGRDCSTSPPARQRRSSLPAPALPRGLPAHLPARCATTSTGARISVRRSMGMTPAATISALLLANLGSTRPGQSHRHTCGVGGGGGGGGAGVGRPGQGPAATARRSAALACTARGGAPPAKGTDRPRLGPPPSHSAAAAAQHRACTHAGPPLPAAPPRLSSLPAPGPRPAAATHPRRHVERLEVLGLAGRGRHRRLLLAKDGVDGGGLADVGVAHQPDHQPPRLVAAALVVLGRRVHRGAAGRRGVVVRGGEGGCRR